MAVILVTGANGQLGSELKVASESYYGYQFIFTDADTLDITDKEKTSDYIRSVNPGWIINCAAYTAVDKAEDEPGKAMLVNSEAVRNIVGSVKGSDCRLIHISSDYVFDGSQNTPYDEEAAVSPLGAYGLSKLEGEKHAMGYYNSMVIRTSWLYSSFGSNFVKTILRKAKETGVVKVVCDQTGSPTYAGDLANAIMSIISGVIRNQVAFKAGIFNYSDEGVCSWFDLATEAVLEAGMDCRVIPIRSEEFLQKVKRPSYSVLDKTKIRESYNLVIPHWRSSLKKCIKKLI
jgi:dTDP-4-dehydrorhamnose reductase